MHAGAAPLPVSSGASSRHRLNYRRNRRLTCALRRIAVTQNRPHELGRTFMTRKRSEGKRTCDALRCLKRHLACVVWRTPLTAERRREAMLHPVGRSTEPAAVPAR